MTRVTNNPVLSIVIIGGILVISTPSSLNAVDDIRDSFNPQIPTKAKAAERQPEPTLAIRKEAAAIAEPAKRLLEVGDNVVEFDRDYRLGNLQGYDPAWPTDGRLVRYCSRDYSVRPCLESGRHDELPVIHFGSCARIPITCTGKRTRILEPYGAGS